MRIMNKKKTHHRSGFTLLEIVLPMAILLILITVVYSTFYIVNASHARVAVINDAKDFASINMQAIENLTANANTVKISSTPALIAGDTGCTAIYFVTDATTKESVLYYHKDGSPETKAFTFSQYTIDGGAKKKWSVQATFSNPSKTGVITVKLDIVDNSTGTVYYTLQKDLLMLNIKSNSDISGASSGSVIKIKTYTP
jgi:prepilin-type N-terminal cleavage/methylation domain-containing protein